MFVLLFVIGSSACQFPEAPRNGRIIAGHQPVNETNCFIGATVSYVCNAGYALAGRDSQVCRSDGSWYPPRPPSCVDKHVMAKLVYQPASHPNGDQQLIIESKTVNRCNAAFRTSPWFVVEQRDILPVFVVKIALSSNKTSSPVVTLSVRVGNYSATLRKNPVCAVFTGALLKDRALYLQCSQVLRGHYVILHVRSHDPVSVCELVTYALSTPLPSRGQESSNGSVHYIVGLCFGAALVVIACCLLSETAKFVLRRELFSSGSYERF
ncbi:hypothetical protein IscW_ISCW003288 [Ixodes scapularis]|uniref:Sushi domain-containing protein n=1 Tax=Ixodes scapularis TaxID=6945 RepID=B7PCG3_IXOSC|nr:hypothetical protein IscW_ISCW003288 [Ixodes scapularis]|eukprot:XP_002409817.1 hypothetical protein IscW_ISCW003288 [Ixodes scapularis]